MLIRPINEAPPHTWVSKYKSLQDTRFDNTTNNYKDVTWLIGDAMKWGCKLIFFVTEIRVHQLRYTPISSCLSHFLNVSRRFWNSFTLHPCDATCKQGRYEGGTMPRGPNHWGRAEKSQHVASSFFSTVHLLWKTSGWNQIWVCHVHFLPWAPSYLGTPLGASTRF